MKRIIALLVSVAVLSAQVFVLSVFALPSRSEQEADEVQTAEGMEQVSIEQDLEEVNSEQETEDSAVTLSSAQPETAARKNSRISTMSDLHPIFDFDSYDWSDPAEKLNQQAREKYESTWKNDSRAAKIKAEVDEGAFPTDEAFFGVWDSEAEAFENDPMLNYDYVSPFGVTLYNVLEAVKNVEDGDYSLAKEELLSYYRQVTDARGVAEPSMSTKSTLMSDLLTQNFHVNNNWGLSAMFSMEQETQDVSVDITETVTQYHGLTASLIVHAVHKDDYEAVFYSREAGEEHAPYVDVSINGAPAPRVYAKADGYVTGGAKKNDTSGGTDTRLYAREAALDTATDGILTDEETRRTYLLFDFSSLPEGTVTSATLHLYGGVEDRAETPRNDSGYTKLMMIANNSTAWEEKNLCFSNGELKTYAYSMQSPEGSGMFTAFWGMPHPDCNPNVRQDQELLRFGTWWDILAKQYYMTGNEDYARTAILYLHDFINSTFLIIRGEANSYGRYSSPQTNGGFTPSQLLFGGYSVTLDASSRASGIAKNFHYIMDSEYLTPEIFTTFLKYFRKMGEHFVEDIWTSSEAGGNWGTAQTNGHFSIMAYFPEIAEQEEWSEAISKHLMTASGSVMNEDGSSHELSHSYTSYALGTQLSLKTTAEELGFEFEYSEDLMDRIRQLTLYLMRMANPGGTDPQYGDAGSYTRSYVEERFKFVGDWLQEPELLWMAYDGKQGKKPDYTSYYYPYGKTMAMRSGWGKDDLFLHVTADAAVGTHSHWDDGGIIVSAYGNYLLSDQGYNGYLQDDLTHRWLVSSRGHNTVEINDYNQNSNTPNNMDSTLNKGGGKKGDFPNVTFRDSYDFTTVDLSNVYKNLAYGGDPIIAPGGNGVTPPVEPGMQFKRNILFVKPNFWIVSDYMNPYDQSKENKYSQYWHMTPESKMSIDGQYVLQEGESIGNVHVTDAQIENTQYVRGTGNGAFRSNFADKANIQVVPVDIESVEPKLCYGYYESRGSTPYGRYDKYATGTTGFDTILFPTKAGDDYAITPTPLEVSGFNTEEHQGAASAFTAHIQSEDGSSANDDYEINYLILHEADKKDAGADLSFGSYTTDGDVAYYEKGMSNAPRRAILQGATHLANKDLNFEIVKSAAELSDFTVEWSGSRLALEGAEDIDLTKLMIYAPYTIKSITWNGETVDKFKQEKDYVYFGDDLIDPPIRPVPPPAGGSSGGSGSSGTPSGSGHGSASTGGNRGGNAVVPSTPVTPSRPSEQFQSELDGHWAKTEVSALIDDGIVSGSDGSLHLQDKTTRAEFTKMILGALDIAPAAYDGCFNDVNAGDWYAGYLQAAYDAGIVNGYDGNANPNDTMTREEAVKMMLKALETKTTVNYTENGMSFADTGAVSDWAKIYMETAVSMGLISGMEDNTLRPQDSTLREQAMVIIYRMRQTVADTTQEQQPEDEKPEENHGEEVETE